MATAVGTTVNGSPPCHCTISGVAPTRRPRSSNFTRGGWKAATAAFQPSRVKFDERGRRVGATPLIVQWQGGEPFTVVPIAVATRPVVWHK